MILDTVRRELRFLSTIFVTPSIQPSSVVSILVQSSSTARVRQGAPVYPPVDAESCRAHTTVTLSFLEERKVSIGYLEAFT